MQPQLQEVIEDFGAALERLHQLARDVPSEAWPRRPEPSRWSVGECVAHLNLTAKAFLPPLRDALERGRRMGGPAPERYRRDPIGWLLWRSQAPPVRMRVKTTPPFVPAGDQPPAELIREFERLQEEQVACVRKADGLPLGRLRIGSPFDPRVKYNLFSALTILPRHQHRHLWQAEQAWMSLQG